MASLNTGEPVEEASDGAIPTTLTPEQWEVEGQFIAEQLESGVIPATVTAEQWAELQGQFTEQIVIQLDGSDILHVPANLTSQHFEVGGQFVTEQLVTQDEAGNIILTTTPQEQFEVQGQFIAQQTHEESGVIATTVNPEQLQVEGQFIAEPIRSQEQSSVTPEPLGVGGQFIADEAETQEGPGVIPTAVTQEQLQVKGQLVTDQLENQGESSVIPPPLPPGQNEVEGQFVADQLQNQGESTVIPAPLTSEQNEDEGQLVAELLENQENSAVIPPPVTPDQLEVKGQLVAEQLENEGELAGIPPLVAPEQLEVKGQFAAEQLENQGYTAVIPAAVTPEQFEVKGQLVSDQLQDQRQSAVIPAPVTPGQSVAAQIKTEEESEDIISTDATPEQLEGEERPGPPDENNGRVPSALQAPSKKKYIVLAPTVKVKCGGCGKEAFVKDDASSPDLTKAPYICEICKSRAQKKVRLHQLLNGGTFAAQERSEPKPQRKHPCQDCNKEFNSQKDLKRHTNIHTDNIFQRSLEKQHKCLICDKTYTNGGHLARHMKQHNNENVLRCGVCTKVFYVKEELQEHLQGHSKEDLAAIIAASTFNITSPLTNGSPHSSAYEDPSPYASGVEDIPMEEDLPPEDSAQGDYPSQDYHHQGSFPQEKQENIPHRDIPKRDVPCSAPPPESVPMEHACLEDRVTCGICGHACCCTNYIPLHMENHEEAMVQCRSCGMDFPPTGASINGSHICSICKPQGARPEADKVAGDIVKDIIKNIRSGAQNDDLDDDDEEKRYKCLECDKSYKFVKHLKDHARVHGGGGYRPYRCSTCGKAFTKRYHLNRHQLIHGRALQRPTNIQSRMPPMPLKRRVGRPRLGERRIEEPKPVAVKVEPNAPKRFVEAKEYVEAQKNRRKHFICAACGKAFPRRVPLKRHLLNHLHDGTIPKDHPQLDKMKVFSYVNANTGDVPSPQLRSCPICGKVCKGLHLDRHMKVHTPEEIAKNKERGSVGASPQLKPKPEPARRLEVVLSTGLDHEMDIDKGSIMVGNDGSLNVKEEPVEEVQPHECLDDKVTCGICGHSCCCANYIQVHMETHKEDSDTCGKCGKELGDLPSTSVNGTRICSICTSRSRKQMRLHQILSNRVIGQESPESPSVSASLTRKRIQCPQCPKSFVERKNFREHLRIHTGEKRHHCSICGMGFVNSRNFKRHVWRHTGEKPNWCNICNKGIAGHLARHMRSHSDQKSYVCNMCHKGFNRSEHLKRHLRTHLGSPEEFSCHLCDKKFMRKEHLKRHIKSHEDGTLGTGEVTQAKPTHPPVNDQPYKEHKCTYDVAVCGLCGDACCCGNYIPYHMEVHGEKAEDYLDGYKKDISSSPKGDGMKPVKDHSCTYDAVTCGLCGEVCCCANYIPLHMKFHGQNAAGPAKDHIIQNTAAVGVVQTGDDILKKERETAQAGMQEMKAHPCLHDIVTCGICGEALCCENYIRFHMELHNAKAPESSSPGEDILQKAIESSQIGDSHIQPHPCTHEIAICGVCGEPCCCPNYIPFHMELHKEHINQEPMDQGEASCVANPTSFTDHDVADEAAAISSESVPEVPATEVQASEAADQVPEAVVQVPEVVVTQAAGVAPGPAQGHVVNNGEKVAAEHVEEFDWASVATFLQGDREPGPSHAPLVMASVPTMEPVNHSPIKAEPISSHVEDHPVMDHECLHTMVTCETCGQNLCCINNLITHLDSHKSLKVRCEVCHQDVDITKTVTVLRDGVKIYKCGACVMGVSGMSMSPARPRVMTKVREPVAGGAVDKSIPCPHCDRVLKSRKEYTRHVKIHADVKPFKCDLCDKEFTAMANLRRHLDAHAGVKPHECKICGQFFSGHMARHMRTHTGEKKYTCEICNKGFHRLEHLKRHLGQHLREGTDPNSCKQLIELGITDEPYQSEETSPPSRANWCHICEKNIQGRLARHMTIHSEVKPFECNQCDKAFNRSEHLKRHLEVHAKRELAVPTIL